MRNRCLNSVLVLPAISAPEFVVDDMIDAIDADENGVIDAGEFR